MKAMSVAVVAATASRREHNERVVCLRKLIKISPRFRRHLPSTCARARVVRGRRQPLLSRLRQHQQRQQRAERKEFIIGAATRIRSFIVMIMILVSAKWPHAA